MVDIYKSHKGLVLLLCDRLHSKKNKKKNNSHCFYAKRSAQAMISSCSNFSKVLTFRL